MIVIRFVMIVLVALIVMLRLSCGHHFITHIRELVSHCNHTLVVQWCVSVLDEPLCLAGRRNAQQGTGLVDHLLLHGLSVSLQGFPLRGRPRARWLDPPRAQPPAPSQVMNGTICSDCSTSGTFQCFLVAISNQLPNPSLCRREAAIRRTWRRRTSGGEFEANDDLGSEDNKSVSNNGFGCI